MATVSSQLRLHDGMTGPLKKISSALRLVIGEMQTVQSASRTAIDTSNLMRAGRELDELNQSLIDMGSHLNKVGQGMSNAAGGANNLMGKVIAIGTAMAAWRGAQKAMDFMDTVTNAQNMLRTANGGTDVGLAQFERSVMQAANRSRAGYADFAQETAGFINNTGGRFQSKDQAIVFAETLRKQMAMAGISGQGAANASIQLQQALSMGTLRGQELRSVMQNAPQFIDVLAKSMNKPRDQIKQMAEDGELTAGRIITAMLGAAQETDAAFQSTTMTFEQMGSRLKNSFLEHMQPVIQQITGAAGGQFDSLLAKADQFFGGLARGAMFVIQHWNAIAGVLRVIGVLLGVATAAMLLNKVALIGQAIAAGISVIAHKADASAKMAATGAQIGLNAAIWACPITWIIFGVIALIAIIIALVAHFKKSESTIGAVFGSITMGIGFLGTFFKAIGLMIASAWRQCWNNAEMRWLDFQNTISRGVLFLLEKLRSLINVLNLIPGIKIDTSWVDSAISNTKSKLADKSTRIAELEQENASFMNNPAARWDAVWSEWDKTGKDKWWGAGYGAGAKLQESVGSKLNLGLDSDFSSYMDGISNGIGDIADSSAQTAKNTAASSEDLRYMIDLANREVVNRFTAAEIKLDMTNYNSVNSDVDVAGMLDEMAERVSGVLQAGAEGIHT